MIDFSSNDYLGLAHCPHQLEKVSLEFDSFQHQVKQSSLPLLGATGSRLLSGDSILSQTLEQKLAKIHHREAALLFNSGYDANLSILSSIPLPHDFIIMDELCHNSLIMGIRMGRGGGGNLNNNNSSSHVMMFQHNNVIHLKQMLQMAHEKMQKMSSSNGKDANIIIVVESVYSMDGDVAPLLDIFQLSEEYNASVVVDEAHGLGVYGKTNPHNLLLRGEHSDNNTKSDDDDDDNRDNEGGGTGVLAALGLEHHPNHLCSVYTFGKAAGCHGAVVVASQTVIDYLINYARPFIYSTALPSHSIITIQCAYDSLMSRSIGEVRRHHVFSLVHLFRQQAIQHNIQVLDSPSPIQAVIVQSNDICIHVANMLRENGMDVYPIRYPTVKKGEERIRIILHAHNTMEDVMQLMAMLRKALVAIETKDPQIHQDRIQSRL